ncbi:phage terminase large subunit [Paraburkholderia phenoliruptrix]|uniref:Phage terminase large subunit n=1 Tax=Paraburkholderia phenoliruptrix TaxID=252970 RepID=A0ABV3WG51_9BURK
MATARIALPEKLIPVFDGEADVRGAKGGRGSAKTRSFAKMVAVKGYIFGMAGISGILLCARQFMNSLADSSLEECKRAIEDEPFLKAYYDIGDNYIKSRDGRISFVFAGLDRNIASIKSKGRILVCWVDEAEPVTDEAWTTLIRARTSLTSHLSRAQKHCATGCIGSATRNGPRKANALCLSGIGPMCCCSVKRCRLNRRSASAGYTGSR